MKPYNHIDNVKTLFEGFTPEVRSIGLILTLEIQHENSIDAATYVGEASKNNPRILIARLPVFQVSTKGT